MGVTVPFELQKQITMADNFYQKIGKVDKQYKKRSKNDYQLPGNLHLSKDLQKKKETEGKIEIEIDRKRQQQEN